MLKLCGVSLKEVKKVFFCGWCDDGGPEANLVSLSDTCRNIQILCFCG